MRDLKNELVFILSENEALNKMLYLATSDEAMYAAKAIASTNDSSVVTDVWEEIHNRGVVALNDAQTTTVLEAVINSTDPKYSPSNRGTTQNVKRYIDDLYEDLCGNADFGEVVDAVGAVSNDFNGVYQDAAMAAKIGMWQATRSAIIPFITTPIVNGKPLIIPKSNRPTVKTAASSSFKKMVREKDAEDSPASESTNDSKNSHTNLGIVTPKCATDAERNVNPNDTTDIIKVSKIPVDLESSIELLIRTINKLREVKNDDRVFPGAKESIVDAVFDVLMSKVNRDDVYKDNLRPVYPAGTTPSDVKYLARTLLISEFVQKYLPKNVEKTTWGTNAMPFDDIGLQCLVCQICKDVDPELVPLHWSERPKIINQINWTELAIKTVVVLFSMDIPTRQFAQFVVDKLVDDFNLDNLRKIKDIDNLSQNQLLDKYTEPVLKLFNEYVLVKQYAGHTDPMHQLDKLVRVTDELYVALEDYIGRR